MSSSATATTLQQSKGNNRAKALPSSRRNRRHRRDQHLIDDALDWIVPVEFRRSLREWWIDCLIAVLSILWNCIVILYSSLWTRASIRRPRGYLRLLHTLQSGISVNAYERQHMGYLAIRNFNRLRLCLNECWWVCTENETVTRLIPGHGPQSLEGFPFAKALMACERPCYQIVNPVKQSMGILVVARNSSIGKLRCI